MRITMSNAWNSSKCFDLDYSVRIAVFFYAERGAKQDMIEEYEWWYRIEQYEHDKLNGTLDRDYPVLLHVY